MIVAGFGCRATASPAALRAALDAALRAVASLHAHDGGIGGLRALAAPADRLPCIETLAAALDLPLIAVPEEALRVQHTATRSARSLAARGCGSVAEAAALTAARAGAHLLAARHVSPDRSATCAIAEGKSG